MMWKGEKKIQILVNSACLVTFCLRASTEIVGNESRTVQLFGTGSSQLNCTTGVLDMASLYLKPMDADALEWANELKVRYCELQSVTCLCRNTNKEIIDGIGVVIWSNGVLRTQKLLLRRDTAQYQQRLEAVVGPKQDIGIQTVTHHTDSRPFEAQFRAQIVDHKWRWLPHYSWFLSGASLDSPDHAAVPGPLLSVRQMGDCIEIGGNELASRIFVDAQLSILDLVVVNVTIKANNDGPHIMVVFEEITRAHFGLFALILRATNPWNLNHIQFFADTNFAHDIDLLPCILKVCLFQIGCSCKARTKDFFGRNVQTEAIKLLFVSGSGFGGVIRHEEHFFTQSTKLRESFGNPWDEGIALLLCPFMGGYSWINRYGK